ncbi:MAG: hypothetical protein OXG78_07075 [Chloroflexi bacterium]|nr:hypothetical protein [Chloroflexota bacterium]
MTVTPHSGTDIAYTHVTSPQSKIHERNLWPTQDDLVLDLAKLQSSVIRFLDRVHNVDWAATGIQDFEDAGSATAAYRHDMQLPSKELSPWSSLYSSLVPDQHAVLQVTRNRLRTLDFVAYTTTEPLHGYSRNINALAWFEAKEPRSLSDELSSIFELAEWEDFEDGVETEFSRQIEAFILQNQDAAVSAIWRAIADQSYFEQDIAEALLWIGLMRNDRTIKSRRGLLVYALESESVFIRDAAVSALSYLVDAASDDAPINTLTGRLEIEPSPGVKSNIRSVLRYFRRLQ